MKKNLFRSAFRYSAAALTLSSLAFSAQAQTSGPQLLPAGYNEFGFRLLRGLCAQQKTATVSISPYSVATVLAMAHNGAAGRTRREIGGVLGVAALSPAALNSANAHLRIALSKADPQTRLTVANAVWTNRTAAVKAPFLGMARQFYAARAEKADFSSPATLQRINDWTRERTAGKIPSILDSLDRNSVLVLVNALYFKGQWSAKFDPALTRSGTFYGAGGKRAAHFMEQTGEYYYLENASAQMLRLPYGNGRYAMCLALPKGKLSADALIGQLNAKTWRAWTQSQMPVSGTVKLPKMKLKNSVELSQALAALGMPSAFSQNADFANLTPEKPVWVSKVQHKTIVEVDEAGTEAAAATGMRMMRGPGPAPFTFNANRPFVMAIQEMQSGAILFLCRVA